jgi:outer membrane protein assembly complex protein YaeT
MPGWVCLLFFLVAGVLGAELPDPRKHEGKSIVDLRFEPRRPETELPLRQGAPFRLTDLRAALKKLHATGRYGEIGATAQPVDGGVAIVVRTEPQWFIGRVDASGPLARDPTRGQAADSSRLELGRPLYPEEVQQASERILALLKRNGFYEARVEPVLERYPPHNLASVRFAIAPGKRARFDRPAVAAAPGVEEDKVVKATKWKGWFRWKSVTEDRVQTGLQRVRGRFEKQDRLMARVAIEGMDYDPARRRLVPRLRVVPGPKVELHLEGAEISKKKLKQYVPIYVEQTVDRDLLVEGARNLRDYYQSRGYFDVRVDFEQHQRAADHHDIVYRIDLGARQKLVHVEVQGNRYFDTDTIRERMFLQTAGWVRLRHGRYSERYVERDQDAIESLYQSNGFRDVKVASRAIPNYRGKTGEMAVVFTIEEGPQYLVSSFEIEGLRQLDPAGIRPTLASIEGQPFSETNVALDRDFIVSEYQAAGFPDAVFDWEMRPGPQPHQVAVTYRVDEGRRRLVREVVITGMEITRQRLIRPAMRLRSGQPLSLQDMTRAQRDLYELGVFDKVDTAIQNPDGETERHTVLYQIDEGDRYSIAGGIGAEVGRIGGSKTGLDAPAGATGFSPRVNLDVSRLHLWGLGHSLNFKSRVSTLQRRVLLNYSAPRYRNVEGRNISVTAMFDDSRDVRTFSARRWETSAQLSQKLSKAMTMLYRLSFRRSTVDRNTLKIDPLLIPQLAQPARVGMLSGNLIDDRRDDPTDSRRGIYSTVDLGLASQWFASRQPFLRFLGRNSTYHAIGNHVILARNVQFGWLRPFRLRGADPAQAIPLPERFFGGGSTSHRGFPDNQAGPRDLATGFPLGGNVLLFHNTELRFPLMGDNLNGVLFHDMGNVFSRPGKLTFRTKQRDLEDFDYMVHAVGFGVRYRTPVGPVRIDLAYSLNPPRFFGFEGDRQELLLGQGERGIQRVSRFQFFFSIGQTF